jgi:hypothetical protein
MDIATTACNVCGRMKRETNHWLKVYTTPLSTAILFAPAAEPIDATGYVKEDICGQECLHKRLSRWLESQTPQPAPVESVTA